MRPIGRRLSRGLILIGGTSYAGEIKKAIFTVLNYLLPRQGVLSMHCSANVGAAGDVALFFGLSGTGKTTPSSDPRRMDFDDEGLTETPRAAYPLGAISNYLQEGRGPHPDNIFFLTADAFGVLPPVARLTPEQAMYYFLSGYTSKLAATERGLGREPQATFSACLGAPFLPLHPPRHARLQRQRIPRRPP